MQNSFSKRSQHSVTRTETQLVLTFHRMAHIHFCLLFNPSFGHKP